MVDDAFSVPVDWEQLKLKSLQDHLRTHIRKNKQVSGNAWCCFKSRSREHACSYAGLYPVLYFVRPYLRSGAAEKYTKQALARLECHADTYNKESDR